MGNAGNVSNILLKVRFRNLPTAYRRCKTRNPKRPLGA